MQVSGAVQGTSTIPRRRRLNVLLAVLAVAATVAVLVWVVPPATTSGAGADDARPNAGAGVVQGVGFGARFGPVEPVEVPESKGMVLATGGHGAGYYPLPHGKAADANADAGSAVVHDDAGSVNR